MGNTSPAGNLLFGFIDFFQKLQAILHPFVFHHIHQNGDCSAPDGSSAGDHFNPTGAPHGNPTGDDAGAQHHAGDMPNVTADDKGNARVDLRVQGVTLGDGGENDVLGKAVIVHADADDYSSQPSGNAGARIACGVIAAPPSPAEAPAS